MKIFLFIISVIIVFIPSFVAVAYFICSASGVVWGTPEMGTILSFWLLFGIAISILILFYAAEHLIYEK